MKKKIAVITISLFLITLLYCSSAFTESVAEKIAKRGEQSTLDVINSVRVSSYEVSIPIDKKYTLSETGTDKSKRANKSRSAYDNFIAGEFEGLGDDVDDDGVIPVTRDSLPGAGGMPPGPDTDDPPPDEPPPDDDTSDGDDDGRGRDDNIDSNP